MTAALYRILSVILLLLASTSLSAQEKNSSTTLDEGTVALVNGQAISELVVQSVLQQLQANGEPADRESIIDELINLEVLTQAAEKHSVSQSPEVAAAVRLQYTQTLANAYLASKSNDFTFTDDELRAEYALQAEGVDRSEYRPSHILVESETIASDIISRLNDGESFEDLAKEHSIDPGGENGGDLGWVQGASLPPELMNALEQMSVGDISQQPISTEFGLHIVKLVEVRQSALPDFQTVKQGLLNFAMRKALAEHVESLRAEATIAR